MKCIAFKKDRIYIFGMYILKTTAVFSDIDINLLQSNYTLFASQILTLAVE